MEKGCFENSLTKVETGRKSSLGTNVVALVACFHTLALDVISIFPSLDARNL